MDKNEIKLLLLEDNPDDLELILLQLNKASFKYSYKHVGNGPLFEQILNDYNPDIVLSDYNISGYDIFKAMDALANHKIDVPFILVTGTLGDEKAVDLIVKGGVSDYILKDNLARLNPSIQREYLARISQKSLDASEVKIRKLSLVASHTHNGVIIADKFGKIEWVNKAFTEITGYTSEESIGKYPGPLLQGPKTNLKTKERIRNYIKEGVRFTEEILNYNKNGEEYWNELSITPVINQAGDIEQYIAIQDNITTRKEAEFELQKSYSELVHKEKQLQEMLQEKDILIQEINHRVKNNLAIISGLIELQIMNGNTEPSLVETQNRIHTIAAVHEQLYNTSSFSEVNVSKYFNDLIHYTKTLLISNDHPIEINFNSTLEEININDAIPLGLLINELTTNSIKHAFIDGTGSITIDIIAIDENKIYFSYMDSGKGFDSEILEPSSKEQTSFGMQLINTLIRQLTDNPKLTVNGKFQLEFEFGPTQRGSHSNL